MKKLFINCIYKPISSFWQNIFRTRFQTDMYMAQVQVVSEVHKATFAKYKNIYLGKEVAIIGTGPSLNKYKFLPNAVINIGLNSAICNTNLKLDYLFVQDYSGLKKCLSYIEKSEKVIKFYGCIPYHFYGLKESSLKDSIIPESIINKHFANKYFVYCKYPYCPISFNPNIDYTWLADGGSVAFSAIQFALYTNPKRIYLIGCDCSNGYYNTANEKTKIDKKYLNSWKELKKFADTYYPDTEIISVNPVGLRGLFTDLEQE